MNDNTRLTRPDIDKVLRLCYLGDMMESGGGCGAALRTGIKAAWRKWREHSMLLTRKQITLKTRAMVYKACVRP